MVRDGQVSEDFWAVVAPLLPAGGGRGRPWADHRQVLEGICWRYRPGSPWRDLPAEFGPWQTVWNRHFRWSTDGTYQQMLRAAVPNKQPCRYIASVRASGSIGWFEHTIMTRVPPHNRPPRPPVKARYAPSIREEPVSGLPIQLHIVNGLPRAPTDIVSDDARAIQRCTAVDKNVRQGRFGITV